MHTGKQASCLTLAVVLRDWAAVAAGGVAVVAAVVVQLWQL